MKNTLFTTALAGFGLTLLPLHAEDKLVEKPDSPENLAIQETITTYVVHIKGGG